MGLRRRKRRNPEPDHARDESGRLLDGDTVRPDGWPGWTDALAARPVDPWREPTMLLPVVDGPLLTRSWQADQAGWTEQQS